MEDIHVLTLDPVENQVVAQGPLADLAMLKPGNEREGAGHVGQGLARKLENVPPAIMDDVLAKLATILAYTC